MLRGSGVTRGSIGEVEDAEVGQSIRNSAQPRKDRHGSALAWEPSAPTQQKLLQ